MGFNRLAILDLSEAGHQPMVSASQRFVLVFNGEIYNHLELRSRLGAYTFKGHSDTETICAAFEKWGVEQTVQQLDGMFALAVYDQHNRHITLARDFAGIKPLFYGWNGTTLVAASQYDQVMAHPAFRNNSVNPGVLKLFLSQHFLPPPFGLHQNTYQVSPGELVTFTDGRLSQTRYWHFPAWQQPTVHEQQRGLELLQEVLSKAVRAEMISDVPVGAFLSGGVDSPLICHYAREVQPAIATFSIGSDSHKHDETERASLFARSLSTRHTEKRMQASITLGLWQDVMKAMHEPMADFSLLPTWLVSHVARQQVTVALSGDGGDELFFGYERFESVAKNIRYQRWPLPARAVLYKLDQWVSGNRHLNDNVLFPSQGQAHQSLHSRFPAAWLDRLFPHLAQVSLPEDFDTYRYEIHDSVPHLLQQMRQAEFYGMMQKTLRKVDLASMENSLEVRVPFLKKTVIEASWQLDPVLNFGMGRKKSLLKQLLTKAVPGVPPADEVKRGFTVPLAKWLREGLRDPVADTLTADHFRSSFGVDRTAIDSLLAAHHRGEDLKWPIFTLAALAEWKRNVSV